MKKKNISQNENDCWVKFFVMMTFYMGRGEHLP
jgi:hypothetical protein